MPPLACRHSTWLLGLALVVGCSRPSGDAGSTHTLLSEATRETREETALWRESRSAWLRSAAGPLGVLDLITLGEGDHTIGFGSRHAIPLPSSSEIPEPFGLLTVGPNAPEGERLLLLELQQAETEVRVDGRRIERAALRSDRAPWPSEISIGRFALRLLERADFLALEIRDQQAVHVATSIPSWPASDAARRCASFRPASSHEEIELEHDSGLTARYPVAGHLEFVDESTENPLVVLGRPGVWPALMPVLDRTSGNTSFETGRYLALPGPGHGRSAPCEGLEVSGGRVQLVVDFNRLSNPPCAFTPHAICPRPPESNRLPIQLEFGERSPGTL